MIQEKKLRPIAGWGMLAVCLVLLILAPPLTIVGALSESALLVGTAFLSVITATVLLFGFQAVQPNDARALLLFGESTPALSSRSCTSSISHLAYSPEIAAAMLQRQQAQAVVAARRTIVDGAVGMVHMALDHLAKDNIVELDDERRAAMVSNLLVVLCSDRHAQPVINTGTLYN